MAKHAIAITFEQKEIESWLTPRFVRNTMDFTKTRVLLHYDSIICCRQPNMT